MKEEKLFTKILEWAFDKYETGFTRQELRDEFNPTNSELKWIESYFFASRSGSPIFGHYESRDEVDYFTLTEKGMSYVIDYQSLKDAREESQKANNRAERSKRIAIIGLAFTSVALVVAVVSAHYQRQSNKYTLEQLSLLTAKAVIEPKVFTHNESYSKATEVNRLGVSLRNVGHADTEYWDLAIIPCKQLTISNFSSVHGSSGITKSGIYWVKGEGRLIYEQAFFLDQKDEVAFFDIQLSTTTEIANWKGNALTPLAWVHISGQNVEQSMNFAYIEWVNNKSELKTIRVGRDSERIFAYESGDDLSELSNLCGNLKIN